MLSAKNKNANTKTKANADFVLGFLYLEGKYFNRDIKNAISYFNKSSSFSNIYAKNNLGIIYKHGFGNEVQKSTEISFIYFNEAIKLNDRISMYNLAHLYIYENLMDEKIDDIIDLLIRSLKLNFSPSLGLLCLALSKKYKNDIVKINKYIFDKNTGIPRHFQLKINDFINKCLLYPSIFEKIYEYPEMYLITSTIDKRKTNQNQNNNLEKKNLTQSFYDGFGF